MALAYLIIGILFALVMFAGDLYMLMMSAGGFFIDVLEWFTSSLDIGTPSRGYTLGVLILPVVVVIGICCLMDLVFCIVIFVLTKLQKISKSLSFKICMVLSIINSVLTLLASALGVVCVFWHIYNELLPEMNLVVYVWATVGVVFAVIMTVLAVLNLVRMKKRIAQ
jgi:hypothetical protein